MGGGILDIKSENAFTLIELLAIIVILAIIAVITVPIILNIIENSRKGAATDSAYGYKDAVNKWYVTKLQEDNQFQLADSYTISSDGKLGDIVIPLSGDKPSGGYLNYTNNILTDGCLVIGDYAVTFEGGNATSTIKGECSSSSNNSGNEQSNGGSQQATNPYLTSFDGNYIGYLWYDASTDEYIDNGDGWYTSLNSESLSYFRATDSSKEACVVFGEGQLGTVCVTSSYYNNDYSSAGSYSSDFGDCTEESRYYGTGETCLKGYAKSKADEMLSKGATWCDISPSYMSCTLIDSGLHCYIYSAGNIECGSESLNCIYADGSFY